MIRLSGVVEQILLFVWQIREFGVTEARDLKPNGRNIPVTEENKKEYVKLVCQMKMTGAIRQQLNAFMEGFYDIIPKRLISIFSEQELELLISGLPTIDIDDLKSNSEYHKYQANSLQVCFMENQMLTLSPLSIQNGMVQALIWNIPYRSVGVKGLFVCLNKDHNLEF